MIERHLKRVNPKLSGNSLRVAVQQAPPARVDPVIMAPAATVASAMNVSLTSYLLVSVIPIA